MNENLPVILLAGFALLAMLVYRIGRRRIAELARRYSTVLEDVLSPADTEYTNIGGLVGYHAIYTLSGPHVEEVRATFTFLPRHSLLFYPVSRLFLRQDRMFLTFRLKRPFTGEAHILERFLTRFPSHRIEGVESMHSASFRDARGRAFEVHSTGKKGKERITALFDALPPGVVRHLVFYPGNSTLYVFLRPGHPGFRETVVRLYDFCGRLAGGRQ